MKLTTKSRYGTRLLIDLAINGDNKPIPLNIISSRQNISLKYLEQIILKLKKNGIVKTQRGPFGGYLLAKLPEEITIGDIVRILEGTSAITDCTDDEKKKCGICNRAGDCFSRWVWVEASNAMFDRLDQITIAHIINSKSKPL